MPAPSMASMGPGKLMVVTRLVATGTTSDTVIQDVQPDFVGWLRHATWQSTDVSNRDSEQLELND